MSLPSDQRRVGPFQIQEEIGVGGMGVVYRALYEKNGMEVALKVLAPDLVSDPKIERRFMRETEILKKLRHPNIVRIFGAGKSKTQRFYAMELVEGGSLDTILKKQGVLSWEKTIAYALQIAKALEHAHNAGIVHRDLKPGNLLIDGQGTLKLSDFGIARDTQATALTQAGKTVGTMNFMAPEQISGKQPVSGRTDLYALGCVLFQMLTGRPPFQSENQAELLFKHLDEMPPSVHEFNANVPVWLGDLINELLAKHPDDRPYDALAVQVMLENVKERVAKQKTKQQEATVIGATNVTSSDRTKSTKKKSKKKKDKIAEAIPIYERTWFLLSLLVLMLSGIYGFYRYNVSEARMYTVVADKMKSTDPSDWDDVEPEMKRLLAWYPEGSNAAQVQLWQDQLDMHRAKNRIETNIKFGREPQSEAERLYVEAQQFEKFGDRITALEKYEAMQSLFAPKTGELDEQARQQQEESRPFWLLARDQADKIRGAVNSETDRVAFVRAQLQEADDLHEQGEQLLAREKWRAIVRLYGNLEEFRTLAEQAQARLDAVSSGGTDAGS
ncbi:MAG: serine/threonine protein kinase [Planctomycetaceae bacterium]|nr:serine/threonine protein kinase [Planctomycetaceae bacterium]